MKGETSLPAIMLMTLVNLAIAGFFAIELHPDLRPVASLIAFLPSFYVIRKRYFRRFSAEGEVHQGG